MALTADNLKKIGFNDPNVINGILSDPNQVARYEKELGLNGGGGSTFDASSYADNFIKAITDTLPQVPDTGKTPFAFDEALAKESATQEYDPYYKQQLNDFMTDVNTQRSQGVASEDKLIKTLTAERDTGLSDRGLLQSGERNRPLDVTGAPGSESPYSFVRSLVNQGSQAKTDLNNLLTGLDTSTMRTTRDIAQAKESAIAGGVLQRRGEALTSYLAGQQGLESGLTLSQPLGVLGTITA